MFSFKKKLELINSSDLKERLFFHDVINHTHGLVLYLGQKEMCGETMDQEEIKLLAREIKTLQSLVRDHFDFKHKNLVQTFDWVPFSYAKLAFDHLSSTYFESKKIEVHYNLIEETKNEILFYYPSFYRILNNLIKNIAESSTTRVEFTFTLNEQGIFIETTNAMKVTGENEILEYLSRVILNEAPITGHGLGLESIHHLAVENGGEFSFEISNNTWINRLFLPSRHSKIKTEKIPA